MNSKCFHDVSRPDALLLILGSMPGVASLEAQQYYAHPRNAFWPIMQVITQTPADAPYNDRLQALLDQHIALWDVLASCYRDGSLDSAIQTDSIVVNDFVTWFQQHPKVKHVLLNGGTAFKLFKRHVMKVGLLPDGISVIQCPSTSPAYAKMSLADKQAIWTQHIASIKPGS